MAKVEDAYAQAVRLAVQAGAHAGGKGTAVIIDDTGKKEARFVKEKKEEEEEKKRG
jgi:hypothetical protein